MIKPSFKESLPRFREIDPQDTQALLKEHIKDNKEKLQQLMTQKEKFSWENLLQPLEDMNDSLNREWAPFAHMHGVMETEDLRKSYNEAVQWMTEYHTELAQNEKLFNALESIEKTAEFPNLNPAQRKIIANDLRDFKLSGIHLSPNKKETMAELHKQLSQQMTKFSENLLDSTQGWILHIVDPKQTEGLPPQALQLAFDHAKKRNLKGYVFTLDFPSYSTAIRFLRDRNLRKTMYEAYVTRASDQGPNAGKWDNTQVMEKVLQIRHEIANLVGFPNYAEYSLATKMAKNPEEVLNFLQDLLKRSKIFAEKEYEEITKLAKKLDGIERVEIWDLSYYAEKLRETTFNFSPEDLRPYFPVHKVLEGMFLLLNKLYGIQIQEEEGVEVWHPDVKFYSIYDSNQKLRGGVYIDLYARSNKREGAWMDECRNRRQEEGELQYPVAFLICNFMPPVDKQPALLTHDDVLTLFHEFGHCLHHVLTKIDYPSVAGINGVPWDAVEFPSQFMENYCWEKESLSMIAAHYQTGEKIPEDLYQKMIAAKHFQTGLHMLKQIEFALFDFRIHLEYDSQKSNFIQTILDDVRKQTSVFPAPKFNRFQHSFSHIFAGSYAAGYYSYKWAEVLSSDAYEQFEENGIFDRATGQSFLKNILEIGGVRDPMESFIAFRGRPPKINALLKHSGILEK